nr:hypothetical protein FFPRI1PSEUD_28640 [Pseudomonas sp. FFPRI_1]
MSNSSSTSEGRVLTGPSVENLRRHGFKDLKQVDDVINNAAHKVNQSDGAVVFVQKAVAGSKEKYSLVVEGEEGIVTDMRNFDRLDVQKMARNQGWENFPF